MGGEEAEVGEGTVMGISTGMTETETGTGGMEVGISQDVQAPTRDPTPIIRDHIMTATDLYDNHPGYLSIYSVHCNAILNVCMNQICFV